MSTDPRRIALEILLASNNPKTTLDSILETFESSLACLARRDINLCHAIIFGVLRHRAFLDHLIIHFSDKTLKKIDLPVLFLLRSALFQIVFLERIPDFAIINSTVEIAKLCGSKKASGFLNAILRKAATNYQKVPIPGKKDSITYLSIKYSLPQWLIKKWISAYGIESTKKISASLNKRPPLTARTNTLKISREELVSLWKEDMELVPGILPESIILPSSGVKVAELPGYEQGYFQIQDQAAQLVSHYLAPKPGEKVLDACAGLGGKTFHLAQLMNNKGKLTAMDISKNKLKRLESESIRLGISIVDTIWGDVKDFFVKNFPEPFDKVLVDAPCTGLGVLRRNPDTKWKRSLNQIQAMASRQKKILNAAANLVRPGGVLVFAVCSCEKEETHEVLNGFLSKRKDFMTDSKRDNLPYWKDLLQNPGSFASYPNNIEIDGFFAARLRRKKR